MVQLPELGHGGEHIPFLNAEAVLSYFPGEATAVTGALCLHVNLECLFNPWGPEKLSDSSAPGA